jgi:hypothetical protein
VSIVAWPDVLKTPADVKSVPLDWTGLIDWNTSGIVSHSVAADVDSLEMFFDDGFAPSSLGGVQVADLGFSGNVQTIQVSAGSIDNYSIISATVGLADGTSLTRCFRVLVR